MGFLDKLRRKKDQAVEEVKEKATPEEQKSSTSSAQQAPQGRRIKKYTSEGKPIYE